MKIEFYPKQFVNEFARKNLDKIPESPHMFVRCRRKDDNNKVCKVI